MVKQVYKCNKCGMVMFATADYIECCGQEMKPLEPQTADWKGEKHVPKINIDGNNVTVDVGISMGTPHPMTEEHHIKWINLIGNDYYEKINLKPGDEPKATFIVPDTEGLWAREYCNLHGLWRSSE
jgi:superoxide reductase